MTKKPLIVLFLASLIGLVAAAARADDSALLYRATPPPDVLVILDTSQSMTWFNLNGATVGDELCYPTSNCPPPDPTDPTQLPTFASRMWMSKFVLSNVVGSYGDKINFGLASYYQGNAATNVIVQSTGSGSPRSWYYSEGWYKAPAFLFGGPAYTIGNRYYPPPYYFDLRVPQAGRGGPANAADPAGYDPATLHPNSPSFTLTWALQDPSTVAGGQNPAREFWAGQPYIGGTSHNEFRCRYTRQRTADPDNDPATLPPGAYANYGATWDTLVGGGCLAAGTITVPQAFTGSVTVTDTCTFVQRLTYDTPTPYQYSCQRYSNGTATGGPWNEYYQNDRGPSFPRNVSFAGAYWERTISLGQVTITVTDTAGQAYRPDQYRWRYYYEATCKANCKNPGKFWQWNWVPSGSSPWGSGWYIGDATAPTYGYTDCKANQVSNPWTDPATLGVSLACAPYRNAGQPAYTPSATGTWGVPLDAEYKWQGNNYALTTDNSCNGGQVLVEVGAGNQDAIKNFLGTGMDPTKELHAANRSTPLGGSLDTALTYFTDPAGVVQTDTSKDCRKHYVLLITDGGESCLIDLNVPGQRAAALAAIPPPTLPNGVKTYVVGIDQGGLTTDERNVLNDIAAKGGTVQPHFASNMKALMDALLAIIGNILSEQYTFVNPVVPTVRAADNLMLIQGSFKTPLVPPADANTPLWQGILAAYEMDPQGGVATTNQKITAPLLWEAGANLATVTRGPGTIKTVVGGSLVDFQKTNAVRSALSVTLDVNNNGTLEASTLNWADTDQVIDTVRGNQDGTGRLVVPGPAGGTKAFLGDIFHSVPIVVGPPIPTLVDRTFDPANPTQLLSLTAAPDTLAPYRTAHNTRQRLALVGANDGMLHAFNAGTFVSGQYNTGDGSEVWAFIPPQMLPKLQYLAVNQGHQWYFVDGTPRAADVWLDDNNDGIKAADGSEWHTVLVGGFRQGGTGLYALDLTNTTSPTFMWTYPTTGQSWSEPAFGKVMVPGGSHQD